jgi:FkbM family methyltransferase
MNTLELRCLDEVTLAVPATLRSITAYVLLEQECWFEKEMDFLRHWMRPGMTAIDIGANLGVYSLPMARLVGATGHVFAYEPGSEARALLERSRELNEAINLDISPLALSDREREGRLVFGVSSELNALGDGNAGETVRVTSLDSEDALRGWPSPDFVKIDAEGEEERILAGGRNFFSRHSPLVMFEMKAENKVNEHLRMLFPSLGYRLFRQLGGAPILVPDDMREPLDGYELNLFAAKADRASALSRQGFLVDELPPWVPGADSLKIAGNFWRRQSFAALSGFPDGNIPNGDTEYRNALAAYATWRAADRPVTERCAALAFALRGLRTAGTRVPSAGRLSTLARIAWEWGARAESVAVLRRLLQTVQSGQIQLGEPFLPANPRFDKIAPGRQPANCFATAAAEQLERSVSFSSLFVGASPYLAWLCAEPFASTEMERRRVLVAARSSRRATVPSRLWQVKPDHLNADVWRAGKVPGTVVEADSRGRRGRAAKD